MKATGRSVLVTGSSTGIGRATARHLDRLGWQVFAGVRSGEDARRLAADLSPSAQSVLLDVTDPDAIAAAVERIAARTGGRLDALVNNAGIVILGPFEALRAEAWREQYEVNVFGLVDVTRAALPLLRAGRGRIVNVGSISAEVPWPFQTPYASSKRAVRTISSLLRIELRPHHVDVVLVEPGVMRTALWRKPTPPGLRRGDDLDPALAAGYARLFRTIERAKATIGAAAPAPESVARTIARVLGAPRPRAYYRIGFDAHLQAFLTAVVPAALRDAVLACIIGRIAPVSRRR